MSGRGLPADPMTQQATAAGPEARLKELGLTLPSPAKPMASYVPWVRTGNLIFIAGQIPTKDGKFGKTGKVGKEVTLEEGQQAARTCALNGVAWIKEACGGDLSQVKRIVKVVGFVAAAEGFTDIPKVINGASELLVDVFGENGKHARSAVGCAELPFGVPVEVEFIVEVA